MKILAPVNSLETTIKQIESGANEIYLSADEQIFNNFTFSGRGKLNRFGKKTCPDYNELKDIVIYAHDNDVSVMYTANLAYFTDNIEGGNIDFRSEYLKYVEAGINANVDSIVVGDIGTAMLIKNEGYDIHLSASSFFESINKEQIHFLSDLGFKRVVVSFHLTLDEIRELVEDSPIEVEIMGHYGCAFFANCNLTHTFGQPSIENIIEVPCTSRYDLVHDNNLIKNGKILDSQLWCSICSLAELNKMGIYALKLLGRDLDMNKNYEVTRSYRKIIDYIKENRADNISQIKQEMLPVWWESGYCNHNTCKFVKNKTTQVYI